MLIDLLPRSRCWAASSEARQRRRERNAMVRSSSVDSKDRDVPTLVLLVCCLNSFFPRWGYFSTYRRKSCNCIFISGKNSGNWPIKEEYQTHYIIIINYLLINGMALEQVSKTRIPRHLWLWRACILGQGAGQTRNTRPTSMACEKVVKFWIQTEK